MVVVYNNGLPNGPVIKYHTNGNVSLIGYYKNGLRCGAFLTYNGQNKLESILSYDDDKKIKHISL